MLYIHDSTSFMWLAMFRCFISKNAGAPGDNNYQDPMRWLKHVVPLRIATYAWAVVAQISRQKTFFFFFGVRVFNNETPN